MTEDSCVDFIKFTTATPMAAVLPTDERIVTLFNTYDEDCDRKLTLDDFLKFYRDACRRKVEVVWSNLAHAKYGHDLKPLVDQNNPDDPLEQKNIYTLPRCKLSNNQEFMNELIQILQILPIQAQDEMWQLIVQLRTNPVSYSQILSSNCVQYLSEQSDNMAKLLYSLQIVDSFVNEYQTKRAPEIKCYYTVSPH